jgi:peptidoglycan/LPS O-acetylase OafA/YrhL
MDLKAAPGPGRNSFLLRHFIVPSSSGEHFSFLDGVRGLAVVMVVLFHSWSSAGAPRYRWHLANLLAVCFTGVDLFFILSGFLLAQAWIRSDFTGKPAPAFKGYIRRRWYRIAPGYYCALSFWVLFFIPMITPPQFLYSAKGIIVFGVHALMLENLVPLGAQYNPTWWTIPVEFLFYVLLPFVVCLFFRKRFLIGLLVSLLVSVSWTILYLHPPQFLLNLLLAFHHACLNGIVAPDAIRNTSASVLVNQLPTYLLVFALGIALANLYVRKQLGLAQNRLGRIAFNRTPGAIYFIAGWIITLLAMNRYGHHVLKGKMIYLISLSGFISLGFALIIAGLLFGPSWTRAIFNFPPLRLFGLVGYSAYLWHIPVIFVATHIPFIGVLPPAQRFPVIFFHTAIGTLMVASFFYLTVEKPFLIRSRPFVRAPLPAPISTCRASKA